MVKMHCVIKIKGTNGVIFFAVVQCLPTINIVMCISTGNFPYSTSHSTCVKYDEKILKALLKNHRYKIIITQCLYFYSKRISRRLDIIMFLFKYQKKKKKMTYQPIM